MPSAPKFKKINIGDAIATGIQFDTEAYNLSDADFSARFGENLVPGRDFAVAEAERGITGQQSPVLTNALQSAGFGDVDFGNTTIKQSKNLGNKDILSMDKRGRDYFQKTLALNPKRTIGPSGKNVSDIALANTAGHNMFNMANYGSSVNNYSQRIAQQAANNAAYAKSAVSLAGLGAQFMQPRSSPYLDVSGYGPGYTGRPNTSGPYYPATTSYYG